MQDAGLLTVAMEFVVESWHK